MRVKSWAVIALFALSLAGCADFSAKFTALKDNVAAAVQVFEKASTATVEPKVVIAAAYSFDAVKATATNYGEYCITEKMAPAICSADIRRTVVKSIRSGTAARNALKASIADGTPALATTYNVMVEALNALKAQPIAQAPGAH